MGEVLIRRIERMVDLERAAALGHLALDVEIARERSVSAGIHAEHLLKGAAGQTLQDEPGTRGVSKLTGCASGCLGLADYPNATRAMGIAEHSHVKSRGSAGVSEHGVSAGTYHVGVHPSGIPGGSPLEGTHARSPVTGAIRRARNTKDYARG